MAFLNGHNGTPKDMRAQKQACYCKKCKKANGDAYDNRAGRMFCNICGIPKSKCEGGSVPPSKPSVRVGTGNKGGSGNGKKQNDNDNACTKEADLERKYQILLEEVKQLKKSGVKEPDDVVEEDAADELGKDLEYFNDLTSLHRKRGRPETDPIFVDWLQQVEKLKAKKESAKPVSKQFLEIGREVNKLFQKVQKKQTVVDQLNEQAAKINAELGAAANDLLNAKNALATAEAKQSALAETCAAANAHSKPLLEQLSREQLGDLRNGLGQLGQVGSLGSLGFDVGALFVSFLEKALPTQPSPTSGGGPFTHTATPCPAGISACIISACPSAAISACRSGQP